MLCDCSNLSLPNIGASKCGTDFGQVQIGAFVDLNDMPDASATSADALALLANIVDKSKWQYALTLTTPKVTLSPILYNPSTTPGDAKTWGGGNATPDGATYYMGADGTTFESELRKVAPAAVKQMKQLICLAEAGRLGVWLFTGNNGIIGIDATTTLDPIPVQDLFVGDRFLMGEEEPDYHAFNMSFASGWSDNLKGLTLTNWKGTDLL